MAVIFASRLRFTLMGAPPESFFIDPIKSVYVSDAQQNLPFVKMKPLPFVDSYLEFFEDIDVEVKYITKRNTATFDFQTLPRIPGLPIQMGVYKKEKLIATITNIQYNGSGIVGETPDKEIEIYVRFKAARIFYNQFT